MLRWCAGEGFGLTLIETMPLGEVEEDRTAHYLPLDGVRRRLEQAFTLVPSLARTGGPARYFDVAELGRPAWLHHSDQQEFLRRLQPHSGDCDRHGLRLPGARPERGAPGPSPGRGNRTSGRGARPADRRQAGAPWFRDRGLSARGRATHVGYGRVMKLVAALPARSSRAPVPGLGQAGRPSLRSGAPKLRHAPGMSALERVAGIEPARSAWEADSATITSYPLGRRSS